MAEKKKFLLRIDEKVYAALEKWAANDLRSINSQIEYLLSEALRKANRYPNSQPENSANVENPTIPGIKTPD